MTRKIFWDDPKQLQFKAEVIGLGTDNGKVFAVLSQTAFYPTGGGQPSDLGSIESVPVIEVLTDDSGFIRHYFTERQNFNIGSIVNCSVDAHRRQDHTQQHSGQHILSQSFFQLFGAETNGFRIGEFSSEIDLKFDRELNSPDSVISEAIALANSIVFENRKVNSLIFTKAEVATLPLRKESTVQDCIRVVEIENYDLSPCGGTHVANTGEVGMIFVRNWSRAKQMLRVEFVCGVRAVKEFQNLNLFSSQITNILSTGRVEAITSIKNLVELSKVNDKKIRNLIDQLIQFEAAEILQSADRVICKIFDHRPSQELKTLALALTKHPDRIVLFATELEGKAQLIFSSSTDSNFDVACLMRDLCQQFGGKGGGTPTLAQGGIQYTDQFKEYFSELSTRL